MLVQVIVVVFAASVSLVHTRHVVDTSVHRHAGLTEMQHAHTDPITFGQTDTQGKFVVPKINQQQTTPVNSESNNKLRTNQNRDTGYTGNESSRNQYENVSNEPQRSQFTVKAIKPRRIDDRAYNNDYQLTERNKKQLTSQQGHNKTRESDRDNNIYKQDDIVKSTTSSVNPSRDQNRRLYQEKIQEIVRTPIKFEQANDDYNPDRIVFIQNVKDQENSIYNGIVTPPTTKLFTNKPSQTHKDSYTSTTIGPDLEDRVAISGDKCPMGQTKIVGSDRCVKVDT
ncbi:unnamed protein product [Pieris macdunnoughi]|uniref:Uncharacterized protein n=1 Tax=Pieris macdunnoughi TaxID=345717 RepID=A0A821SQE6_9NEOP|nr:unnamed protein product [Pieris macdunnoughi]